VLNHLVGIQDALQVMSGFAPGHHEVLADDLEKIDRRSTLEDAAVVRNAQADPDTEIRNRGSSRHHRVRRRDPRER
jgi:hypothetical protein